METVAGGCDIKEVRQPPLIGSTLRKKVASVRELAVGEAADVGFGMEELSEGSNLGFVPAESAADRGIP